MKQVEQFKWYLPGRTARSKPYLSAWHMSAADAKARGAIAPEPTSREVIMVAETPEEERELRRRTDTSQLGNRRPE